MNATVLLRLKAFMFDYLIILAYLIVLFIITMYLYPPLQDLFNGSLIVAQMTGFGLVTLPISLYFIIFDSVLVGRSYGKKKVGIQVVDLSGRALSVPRSIFRIVLKFLPWELSHYLVYRLVYLGDRAEPIQYTIIGGIIYTLIFIYIFTAIFTKKKQSLYDLIARTRVVK